MKGQVDSRTRSLMRGSLKLIQHLVGVIFLFLAVSLIIRGGAYLAFRYFEVPEDSNIHQTVMMIIDFAIILVTLCALVRPLLPALQRFQK